MNAPLSGSPAVFFDTDFVVIGSGFGGSVSALRLAEKGYRVTVLEQGSHISPDKMPKTTWNIKRFLWLPALACRGFFSMRLFRHMLVLHGNAVGGGSITYANTLWQPENIVWRQGTWAGLQDYESIMPAYYRRAEAMLGRAENQRMDVADWRLKEIAALAGVEDSFYPTQVAVYFGEGSEHSHAPVNGDPYFHGEGPARAPCNGCGGCMVGCRYNAKNTLDKNYLYLAQKRGARLRAETRVIRIEPLPGADDGSAGYRITYQTRGESENFLHCRAVVVAASSLGTQKLLFRMKEEGYLPNISAALGKNVFTNAESLIGVRFPGAKEDFSRGVAIGSGIFLKDGTHIEATRFSRGSDIAGILGTLMNYAEGRRLSVWQWAGALAKELFTHPGRYWKHMKPVRVAEESMIFLCMQSVPQPLTMRYKRSWFWPFKKTLATEGEPIPAFIPAANELAQKAAQAYNGAAFTCLADVFLNIPTTAHCMGGAAVAASPAEGVVDVDHKVFGYQNLYICDGSTISSNLGVNPSLTITALAELAMSKIPGAEAQGWAQSLAGRPSQR